MTAAAREAVDNRRETLAATIWRAMQDAMCAESVTMADAFRRADALLAEWDAPAPSARDGATQLVASYPECAGCARLRKINTALLAIVNDQGQNVVVRLNGQPRLCRRVYDAGWLFAAALGVAEGDTLFRESGEDTVVVGMDEPIEVAAGARFFTIPQGVVHG